MKIQLTNSCNNVVDPRLFMPSRSTEGAAAYDLRASIPHAISLYPGDCKLIPLGFCIDLEDSGTAMLLVPRSGIGHRDGIVLGNLTGVIDSDYRGEVMASLWYRGVEGTPFSIQPGDRVCQALFVQLSTNSGIFEVVESLEDTQRGAGGFGHTGTT